MKKVINVVKKAANGILNRVLRTTLGQCLEQYLLHTEDKSKNIIKGKYQWGTYRCLGGNNMYGQPSGRRL